VPAVLPGVRFDQETTQGSEEGGRMVMTKALQQTTSYDRPYWVSYSSFHYSELQIRWLLGNEDCFEEGCWPKEPAGEYITEKYDRHERCWVEWMGCGSNMVDHQGKGPAKSEAFFCKAKEIYGDVKQRIERAGTPGKLLLAQLRAGYTLLDDEAYNALKYVCGNKLKKTSFLEWDRQRRRRNK
jgi:hypothetical protein